MEMGFPCVVVLKMENNDRIIKTVFLVSDFIASVL